MSTAMGSAGGTASFILKFRWQVFVGLLGLVAFAASGARFIEFATDYPTFFSEDNPQLLAFDDISGTDILGGLIIDTDLGSVLALVEMGTRLNDWCSLDIEFRGFFNQESGEMLYDLRDDDFFRFQFTRHM